MFNYTIHMLNGEEVSLVVAEGALYTQIALGKNNGFLYMLDSDNGKQYILAKDQISYIEVREIED